MGNETTLEIKGAALRPLADKVVIQQDEDEKLGSGILVRPETLKQKLQRGTVVAKGPGAINATTGLRDPIEVDCGDHVFFSQYAGTEVSFEGAKLLIVAAKDIMAVIPPGVKAEVIED